jgi:hypothetical protein
MHLLAGRFRDKNFYVDYSESVNTEKGDRVKPEQLNQVRRGRRTCAACRVIATGVKVRREFMVSFESKVLRFGLGAAKRLCERRRKQLKTSYLPTDGLFHRWAAFCRRVALLDPLVDCLDGNVAGLGDRRNANKVGGAFDS